MKFSPDIYHSDNFLTLDFETDTSGGTYGSAIIPENGMVMGSWKVGHDGEVVSRFGNEYQFADLVALCEEVDFIVAHNANYELGWLHRMGLDLHKVQVFCTKIGEYVLMGNLASGDEAMAPRSTSLDDCCKRRGWTPKDPAVDIMMKHGVNPIDMPRPWLQQRCELDVESTYNLFVDQREKLENTGRLGVMLTRCIFTPVLADMASNGIALDKDAVNEVYEEYRAEHLRLSKEFEKLTGGVNSNSPKQLGEYLYDVLEFEELKDKRGEPKRTKAGGRKADKATLEALKATTSKQREFVKLRNELSKVTSALSKNLDYYKGICEEQDGIFYTSFNQTTTATHRLSSTGIKTAFDIYNGDEKTAQGQNIPRAFKRLITARREGWLVGEWDGSGLEFRFGIALSQDRQGIIDITSGHDVHKFTASVLNECGMHEVDKDMRQDAKPMTFGPLYGKQSGTPAEKAYIKAFKERYSDMTAMQQKWVEDVVETKRLILPWGMRFYWPYANRSNSGYINVNNAVSNYPIQSGATAEVIPIAATMFWHRVHEEGLGNMIIMTNSVHDSVICEIHPDAVEDFKRIAVDIWHDTYRYLEEVYGLSMGEVPLGTGINIGTHWNTGDEVAYNIYSNGKVEEVE